MTIKYDDKNGSIKRPNEMIQYDKVMISNFAQAAQDIFFFAEHFFYIVHPVSGSQLIQLRDYQKRMLMAFIEHRMNVVLSARQIGKCVHFNNTICIKNEHTGEIKKIPIGEFFNMIKHI